MGFEMDLEPLSTRQAQLVEKHLGLVRTHLRRHTRWPNEPKSDRELDDLYQEGCLGLIHAAQRYDPRCDIPFAAYALRRIHHAVSQALYEGFTIMRVPMRTQIRQRKDVDPHAIRSPAIHRLEDDPQSREPDPKTDPSGGMTIAVRLREKYESAVRRARQAASKRPGRRGDRRWLVDRVIESRLLVPDEQHKTPLRQIARDTSSSYARVAGCEKQLREEIGKMLGRDPEYQRLTQRARRSAEGLEARLADCPGDDYLLVRFGDAITGLSLTETAGLLWQVVEMTGGDPRVLLTRLFARLSSERKASLCDQLDSLCVE